jgi:type II secretory pathway pseudopilin PulG
MYLSSNQRRRPSAGVSMVEITISVAVIGILSAIAVQSFGHIHTSSSTIAADRTISMLNAAVAKYQTAVQEINRPAVVAEASDELAVLGLLTATDATIPGTPFLKQTHKFIASDALSEHRASWNGRWFILVPRNTAGTGLALGQD